MTQEPKLRTTITVAQAIGFLITILITVFSAWVTTQTRITVLEIQMKNGDLDRGRIESKIDKLGIKMDDVNDKVTDLKITSAEKK